MLELEYEMTFAERLEGPLGPTIGFPSRLYWKIAEATLAAPRISACLVMPGTDWIRVEGNGIRRQDQRAQFLTEDGTLILMRYDAGLIRGDEGFSRVLDNGRETTFADQYMCMTPQFDVSNDSYAWLTQSLFIARGRLAGPSRIEYELGLMMARYIIGAEPLASLSPDAVVACIAPVLQHDLAGPIPAEHQLPPSRTSLGGGRRQPGAGPNAKEGAKR